MEQEFEHNAAKEFFERPEVQQSWLIHMLAFGPILDPAFEEDYTARICIISALNHISAGRTEAGMEILRSLQELCKTSTDRAALLFFLGLCHEVRGEREEMIARYLEAGEQGHRFYLPHLKVAKAAHQDADFDRAEQCYRAAIDCLRAGRIDPQSRTILASAWTNLCSCLTMMHRYADAKEAMRQAKLVVPDLSGSASAEAILCAAMGDAGRVVACLEELEKQAPALLPQTKGMVDAILNGRHGQFSSVPLDPEDVTDFWDWFLAESEAMRKQLAAMEFDPVARAITAQLTPMFPYAMQQPMKIRLLSAFGFCQVQLQDSYAVGLREGYRELIRACPEELKAHWSFEIVH